MAAKNKKNASKNKNKSSKQKLYKKTRSWTKNKVKKIEKSIDNLCDSLHSLTIHKISINSISKAFKSLKIVKASRAKNKTVNKK